MIFFRRRTYVAGSGYLGETKNENHNRDLMGSRFFVYGSHWAEHIANLSLSRQPNRSISIIGSAIAKRITGVIRCKILVSAFEYDVQLHALSMDAPPHIHGRIASPSIVNRSEDSSHRSLRQTFLPHAGTHILGSFNEYT